MSDDVIASIEGTATYESVLIEQGKPGFINVTGYYHGDSTTYEAPQSSVFIGGLPVTNIDGPFSLDPPEDEDYLKVEATDKELLISDFS